jgi:uncharacterized protein (TIGR02145 family)
MPHSANFLNQPDATARMHAPNYKIGGSQSSGGGGELDPYFSIGFAIFHHLNLPVVKSYLAKGYPIVFAADIDPGFMNGWLGKFIPHLDGRKVFIDFRNKPIFGEYKIFRHAMVLCGYDDEIGAFKIMNSWGTGKGNDGFFWVEYEYFKKMVDGGTSRPLEMYLILKKRPPVNVTTTLASTCATAPTTVTTGATISVNSTDISVSERGVCFSSSRNPTVGNRTESEKKAVSATADNNFVVNLSGLQPATKYYYRAYVKTNKGIVYGNEMEFTTLIPVVSLPTVSDIDGNTYPVITIGNQQWMQQNLRVTKFNDGTPIPEITDGNQWLSPPQAPNNNFNIAYCWYNNDTTNKTLYGALYNYDVVLLKRARNKNVCPVGWRVPNGTDWATLKSYLGGGAIAGGKMKDAGLQYWNHPPWGNVGGDNCSGFTAMPAGFRRGVAISGGDQGAFLGRGGETYHWIDHELYYSMRTTLYARTAEFTDNGSVGDKYGFSIRCIKE